MSHTKTYFPSFTQHRVRGEGYIRVRWKDGSLVGVLSQRETHPDTHRFFFLHFFNCWGRIKTTVKGNKKTEMCLFYINLFIYLDFFGQRKRDRLITGARVVRASLDRPQSLGNLVEKFHN